MEEDIKILEEKIKIIESLCTDDCINKSTVIEPLKYAIKNLINRNKELEEIKDEAINTCFYTWNDDVELLCRKLAKYGYITIDKEKNEYISPFKDNPNLEESKDIYEDISDYIAKSKVKEKMKEIKSKGICKNTDFCNNSCFYYSTCNVLQDLLEEEE